MANNQGTGSGIKLTATPTKIYAKVFDIMRETNIADSIWPFATIAYRNKTVNFVKMPVQPQDTKNTDNTYIIQRIKRIKAKDSVRNSNDGPYANEMKIYDSLSNIEWISLATKISGEKQIGFITRNNLKDITVEGLGYGEAVNLLKNIYIDNNETWATFIAKEIKPTSTLEIVQNLKSMDKKLSAADDLLGSLSVPYNQIKMFTDDFKFYSSDSNMITFIHPLIGEQIALLNGVTWNKAGNLFGNKITSFNYMGRTFIVVDGFNSINLTDPKAPTVPIVLGAIIMDIEAIASLNPTETIYLFNKQFIKNSATGALWSTLNFIIDPKRIKTLGLKLDNLSPSKKIND